MRFLITNDDGVQAPGIAALAEAASRLGDVVVVAPEDQRSECGHSTTTRVPIRVVRLDTARFAIHGTPADCVRLALLSLDLGEFDYVLSGVNAGGNLGVDRFMSGTVAAAREATLLGKKAMAFSHYLIRDRDVDWSGVTNWTEEVLRQLLEKDLKSGHLWNVNFPHLSSYEQMPEVIDCAPSNLPLSVQFEEGPEGYTYNGRYSERPREEGSDVAECFGGKIALSELAIG